MKALITGGAGFIGSHLAEALLQEGMKVCVIDDLSTGSMDNLSRFKSQEGAEVVIDSILNQETMERLVRDCDIVYHLAAAVGVKLIIQKPIDVIETNTFGTRVVLNLASKYGKQILLASTSEVYGKNTKVPFKEEDDRILGPTTQKRWNYSCSKAINEFLALAYHEERNLDVTIVRLFNTIGPRQVGRYGMVVPRFIAQALSNRPITVYGDGKQIRCFSYVSDVVSALVKLMNLQQSCGRIFNIGSDQGIRIVDLAKKVREMTKSESEIRFIPYSEAYEQGFDDMAIRIPDLTALREAIRFQPCSTLDQSLEKIIAHLKERAAKTRKKTVTPHKKGPELMA